MAAREQGSIGYGNDHNALVRPAAWRRTVAWLTLVAYVGYPMAATAQVIADQSASSDKRPTIDATANGLPMVQIATPNAAGVSHNRYTQFNVDPSGLILNNSQATVLTQQAGYVGGNPNLANGSARIILNEVTSTTRSQLNGYTEVAGPQAEVVIANPNGITCNGCGFINASRGMLTTGTPVIGAGGNLDAFRVTGGDIQIGSAGLNASNISQLDLIARSVQVNGQLWANNLNVITGADQVDYNTLGVQIVPGSGNKPTVGIDVALLGGMYANKIRLIGTEAGVGVNSLGNIAAQAGDFTLDNQGQITLGGTTIASGNISINSNTGIANSGTLYGQQVARLTSVGSITNSGLFSAQGDLLFNAGSVNSTGALGAGIDVSGNATQNGNLNITAQRQALVNGVNVAGGSMSIAATSISLAASKTNAWGGINLNATAGDIDLTSARMQSVVGSIALNATGAVNNTSGLLFGVQITGNSGSFNNTNGSLGAYGDISLTAGSIDNTNGQIGNALYWGGNITLNTTGRLINSGGQIGSDLDLILTANTITGNGEAIAGRNATFNLQGDYTNVAGDVLKANNNLTFNTTGNFLNQTDLKAVGTLTINAANITNAGRIEGSTVETHSNNFTNTATVMGGVVNLRATNLDNLNATAIIGATQSINLTIVNALNNQDGANILSLGDINIGSNLALDAQGYLTGNAVSVTNQSATIESFGNMRISADTITNKRTLLTIGTNAWTGTPVTGVDSYNGSTGSPSYTPTFTEEYVAASTPEASLKVSGNAWFKANAINNEYSSIAIAGVETFSSTLNQTARELDKVETRDGVQNNYVWQKVGWHWGVCGGWLNKHPCKIDDYAWVNHPSYPKETITTPVGYVNATHTASVIKGDAGGVNNQTVSSGIVGGTAATLGATLGSSQGSVTASNGSNTVTVPSSGLYTLHTQPGQNYLVATDPRFTSYQNFVSSDYMLSRMSLDPQVMEKRLGDGFYEQKLVLDQISAQTGRRYLGQYASANDQYIALLDAGVSAAKELKLVPGVALTAAQVGSLTSDIVWLVDQIAVLPNSTTQHVLVPKVYLSRLHDGDLKPNGSLIAADVVDIRTNGTLENSGTIQAGNQLFIQAEDIINKGGTLGGSGDTYLNAANDILNQSGNINGRHVALVAGRDVISERLTDNIVLGGLKLPQPQMAGFTKVAMNTAPGSASSTLIYGMAGITAIDALDISAGRDVTFAGSNVTVGSKATITAGRDLVVRTVTTQENTRNDAINNSRTEQFISSITTGGSLTLVSGKDMNLTSVAMEVGKDAALMAGGDLILDASKNVNSINVDTATTKVRRNDETVLGSTLSAGGNVALVATRLNVEAGRTDGKGNLTLQSTDGTSTTGLLMVAADANVNIGVTEEQHSTYSEINTESHGFTTTTKRTTRSETWRTDVIGSSLNGDSISITSGRDINVIGSNVTAEHNIDVAAMGNLNITAATNTYGSDSYSHETTTGLQATNAFSITDHGPDITSKAHTDGSKQSQNRSSLVSKSDNLNLMAGGNLIATGSDLAADKGDLALNAGGTIALLAGQDLENTTSSTVIVTDPNFFTKQRRTITDTSSDLTWQGSTVQGKSVKLNSGGDLVLQASDVKAGEGGITLDAGNDVKLLAATNQHSRTHTEKLQTDGYLIQADGTIDGNADRRINNKAENQTVTNKVTSLTSAGDIKSHSRGDTRIEASQLDAQGSIDLSATGYAAATNTDGSLKYEGRKGTITFAAVKDSTYVNVENKKNSDVWQSMNGHGEMVETIKLANIKSGKGFTVDAKGGILVDIPEVQKEAPAPQEREAPLPTKGADGKPITQKELDAIVAERAAEKAAKAARDAEAKRIRDEQRFKDHIQQLAGKPGQEWIGQLAKLAKDKPDSVKLQQVNAALEHWDYDHAGLTPEAVAVIVIVVTYFTAGAGSSAVGTTTTTAGTSTTAIGGTTLATTTTTAAGTTVTTYTVAGAAINAGFSTLASQAAISFANNKGDVGKTLDDMGKSENVRNVIAAMLTAGVTQSYLKTYSAESFAAKTLTGCVTGDLAGGGCEKGATTAAILAGSTWINHAMRDSMIKDSETFKGVKDINDPSGKIYNNENGQGSVGVDGDGQRVAGTRISIKGLQELGMMTAVTPKDPNTLWIFNGTAINPGTGKAYTLSEALAAQGGLTGGTQALLPTFAGMPVAPGGFLDKLEESFAGPHDYMGGRVQGGYDSLGNWGMASNMADNVRGVMAGINVPLVVPLVIPTFLRQIGLDPVALSNTIHNGSH